ncbi:MAG: hypothetical protein NTV34_06970 [Proteobacteria bacterium]|nr:hypothetical protein [Pseudomonadota bacterium]
MHKKLSPQLHPQDHPKEAQKGGKRPDHPYRRSFYTPQNERQRAAGASALKAEVMPQSSGNGAPMSQEFEALKNEITGWMRFNIYEVDLRRNSTYKVGTIYGRETAVLSRQVAALLKRKWSLHSESDVKVNRVKHQIDISLSPIRELIVGFELPGNSNIRSLGQIFGILARQVVASISEAPARGRKTQTA